METMLWVVLIVALALALGMAAFAWRVLRRNHARTDARATLLRQMAFEPDVPNDDDALRYGPPAAVDFPRAPATHDLLRAAPVASWEPAAPPPVPPRRWMPVIVVLVFVAVGASAVYGGLFQPGAVEARGQSLPLDLLSLSHRVEAGDLIVTGLVQNPREGQPAPRVLAVVYVFNAQGEYSASAKAALEFAPLAPGAESPFMVRIPKTAGISRFRIGFRAEDGSVVAHLDRRGQPIEGTTAGTPLNGEGR